ncbi:MAG TPA: cytochrome c [Gaiellaceae bacterium]|nr:cytochrome c [Gaiellaceae bacterium]
MRASAALLVVALAAAAAGCGGGGKQSEPAATAGSSARQLFVDQCGACHKLAAAGTPGTIGTNLDSLRPSQQAVLDAIEQGPGTMPADLLTGRDAERVAAYVATHTG